MLSSHLHSQCDPWQKNSYAKIVLYNALNIIQVFAFTYTSNFFMRSEIKYTIWSELFDYLNWQLRIDLNFECDMKRNFSMWSEIFYLNKKIDLSKFLVQYEPYFKYDIWYKIRSLTRIFLFNANFYEAKLVPYEVKFPI